MNRLFEAPIRKKVNEIRRTDLDYEEVPKKKSEPDVIDSVVVKLKGKDSEKFTKLGRRFERARRIAAMLKAEEQKLKDETRGEFDELFDAGDDIFTRVIETASLVFKIAKAGEKTVKKFDDAGWMDKLVELTGRELEDLVKIKKEYETSTTQKIAPRIMPPKEKNPKESLEEGVFSGLVSWVKKRLSSYDHKLAEINAAWEQMHEA